MAAVDLGAVEAAMDWGAVEADGWAVAVRADATRAAGGWDAEAEVNVAEAGLGVVATWAGTAMEDGETEAGDCCEAAEESVAVAVRADAARAAGG